MSDPQMGATAAASAVDDRAGLESGSAGREAAAGTVKPPRLALSVVSVGAILLTTSAAGAALLVWWAVNFHPDDEQTWMVPVGLVLFGTPIVAWFSVFASDFARRSEKSMNGVVNSDASRRHEAVMVAPMVSAAALSTGSSGAGDRESGSDVKNRRS